MANLERTALTEKIVVLGVDGLDPMLARHLIKQGQMPNLEAFIKRGAAREDLVLLGAVPTVTPPMWTTLATGAYPETHGITGFHNPHPSKLGTRIYALDSRMCRAEPLWNAFAEAGKKTLVWHWPGSSWPPTSASPDLAVVDGTQPAAVNMGTGLVDWETAVFVREKFETVKFIAFDAIENVGAGCVITDLDDIVASDTAKGAGRMQSVLGGGGGNGEVLSYTMDISDCEAETLGNVNVNKVQSSLRAASGWLNAPEGAKEFILLTSKGFVRRPALVLPDAQGRYQRVAIYKSKKDSEPLVVLTKGVAVNNVLDEIVVGDTKKIANRNFLLLDIDEATGEADLWMTIALDIHSNKVWHPQSLQADILANVGFVPSGSLSSAKSPVHAEKLILAGWENYCQWQANALTYLMDQFDVIFSHLHNVDGIGHQLWHFAKHRESWGQDEVFYQGLMDETYRQTDRYLGKFLPYLDCGWTIMILSDHGLICEENEPPGLGEAGINGTVMKELGYTVFQKDAQGHDLRQLDLSKTRAVAYRGCHLHINLKGKFDHGIVEPADQYALEEQIISDLYNYRDPQTGKRVVALALRKKDAAIMGLNGPECGDIIFFMEEGFNIIHVDSLPTQRGYYHTSVSPIFVAAGTGIKAGFTTDRVIRQVDVAPTIAALGGVRMPAQCEGAPAYQILTKEF